MLRDEIQRERLMIMKKRARAARKDSQAVVNNLFEESILLGRRQTEALESVADSLRALTKLALSMNQTS